MLTVVPQIWFQNRRQSSRRKSRPLLPHEIAQYQYQLSKSAATPYVGSPATGSDPDVSQAQRQNSDQQLGNPQSNRSSSRGALEGGAFTEQATADTALSSPQNDRPRVLENNSNISSAERYSPGLSSQYPGHVTSFDAPSTGTISSENTSSARAAPVLYDGQCHSRSMPTHGHPSRSKSPRRVRKVSSFVRLAMTAEGGAEVIAKDTSSPSPPRASMSSNSVYTLVKGAPTSSQSDAAMKQVPAVTPGTALHRAPSGRSRDSRAWEFWCDKDCRSELEEKAEKDASGSAADAIQLLRSASGRSILGTIPAKRNSTVLGHSDAKRLRGGGRMSLQRSSTSNGRLQGKQLGGSGLASKTVPKLKNSKSALSVHVPGNDSDKENWSPSSDLQSEEQQSVFADGEAGVYSSLNQRSRHSTGPYTLEKRRSGMQRGSIDPENDPEIAAFMRAGRESDKVSDHEELDCVQGLLSLSQGNWR